MSFLMFFFVLCNVDKNLYKIAVGLNPVWHDIGKQEKCSSFAKGHLFIKLDWCKFSPPKSLNFFEKKWADKIWSIKDKGIKMSHYSILNRVNFGCRQDKKICVFCTLLFFHQSTPNMMTDFCQIYKDLHK